MVVEVHTLVVALAVAHIVHRPVVDNRDDCLLGAALAGVDGMVVIDNQDSCLLMVVAKKDRTPVAVVDIQVFALKLLH